MARIRRINVSQIEGNGANVNNLEEIRPFGEAGFFINEDEDTLELLMFDGERTHLKSKVLGNGILYGANLDGGDGLNTIKLVPDAESFINGNHQYIVVDPTAPSHIHLRAGGDIDASSAELYLGGEINNVRVSDSGSVAINAGDVLAETSVQWSFDLNGAITFPDSTVQTTAYTGGDEDTFRIVSVPTSSIGASGDLEGDVAVGGGYVYFCTQDFVALNNQGTVITGGDSNPSGILISAVVAPQTGWTISYSGNSGTITQAVPQGDNYVVIWTPSFNIPTSSTVQFGPASSTNIWKRIQLSADTW